MPTKKLVGQDLCFGHMVQDLVVLDYEKAFRFIMEHIGQLNFKIKSINFLL